MLFMAATCANIDKKMDSIQDMQKELLDFLAQKERSELKGDLNFLVDVINNYKYNWNNEKYKNNNHIKVLDIMQESERKLDFFREQITSKLMRKSMFYSDQEVKKQLDKMQSEFKDYQVSLYLYSFSAFLQVILLENFESAYLEEVANKIAGETVAKIPLINKSQIDETLLATGERIGNLSSKRIEQAMEQLIETQSAYVRPFIENINEVNRLYNRPLDLLFDEENLYFGAE